MVLDGLRGYLQLASGLTDVTRERARATAKNLLAQGEAGVGAVLPENVRTVTDDLIATSRANRDLLLTLVRGEVERSVSRLGLVSAAELDAAVRRARRLEERVVTLETQLREAMARLQASGTGTTKRTTKKSAARKGTAKKSSARKSAATKSASKRSTAKRAAAKRPPESGSATVGETTA